MVTPTSKVNQFLKKLLQMSVVSSNRRGLAECSWGNSQRVDNYEQCCQCLPEDVPAGCLPVYVGQERRRFVIPTAYLSNSNFRELLAKSAEEYGLRCEGGLRIACAPEAFQNFLWCLEDDGCKEWMQHCHSG